MSLDERFLNWTTFEHYSEKDYFQFLQENLPQGFYVIHSKYIETKDIHLELDFIVICPGRIYLVEQKCWGHKVVGNDYEWEVYRHKDPEPIKRKSPYKLVQDKQRKFKTEIQELYGGKYIPIITSVIVLGSPGRRKIERQLKGKCKSITFTPEESLTVFLQHDKYEDKKQETKLKKQSRAIFDFMKRTLEDIDKIEIECISLMDSKGWELVLRTKNDEIYIEYERGNFSDPKSIMFDIKSPSLQTNYYFEALGYLKETIEKHLISSSKLQIPYIEGLLKISQNWVNTIKKGKILPGIEYIPLLKFKDLKDVYLYLSGGLVRVDTDYHPSFRNFRENNLKQKSVRDNFLIIEGLIGSGKTTQLCRIAYESMEEGKDVYIVNPEISIPEGLKIHNSVLIIDNFSRVHPKNIQIIKRLADSGKNIVYGCLRKELSQLVIKRYQECFENAKIPWRAVELPEWSYELQFELFSELQNDWKCYVVEESIPSLLQYSLGNPTLLSEPLKFPIRTRGSPSVPEAFIDSFRGGIGVPSMYIKHLRLISDFVDISKEDSEKVIKSIFIFVNLNQYFPEFIWHYLSKELDLLPLDNPIMQSFMLSAYSERCQFFERWKNFFQYCKTIPKKFFIEASQTGEDEKFKQILKNLNLNKWNDELGKLFKNGISFDANFTIKTISSVEKIILSLVGLIDEEEIYDVDIGQLFVDITKLPNNILKQESSIPVIILMLSLFLEKSRKPELIAEKLEKSFVFIKDYKDINTLEIIALGLRNLIEWLGFNGKKINEKIKGVFEKYKSSFLEKVQAKEYIKKRNESFPVEIYRIAIWIDEQFAETIKEELNLSHLFSSYIEGLIEFYWLRKNQSNLDINQKWFSFTKILLRWLWDLKYTSEEFELYGMIIDSLSSEKKDYDALCICLSALNISLKTRNIFVEEFFKRASEISKQTKNKLLLSIMESFKTMESIFQPEFLSKEFNDFDKLLETYQAILYYIHNNQIEAAKGLFDERGNLIKKHDQNLYSNYNHFFDENIQEEIIDFQQRYEEVEKYIKENNSEKIIELTNDLPIIDKPIRANSLFLLYRERATALRNLGKYDESLSVYLQAYSLSFLDILGSALRSHTLGQIGVTFDFMNNQISALLMWLLNGRLLFPHLFIRRVSQISHLPNLNVITDLENQSRLPDFSTRLRIYDTTNLLANKLAGSEFKQESKRLAAISLKDSEFNADIKGQCYSLMLLSRIAYLNQENSLEEECYNKAVKLSKQTKNLDAKNILRTRKMPFEDIFSSTPKEKKETVMIEKKPIRNLIEEIQYAMSHKMYSQELFERGLDSLDKAISLKGDEKELILLFIGLYQISSRFESNLIDIASRIKKINIDLIEEENREIIINLSWDIITDFIILQEEIQAEELLSKISQHVNIKAREMHLTLLLICITYRDRERDKMKNIAYKWIEDGIYINFFDKILVISIDTIMQNIELIIQRILFMNDELFFKKMRNLEQIFPNVDILSKIIDSCYEMNLQSSSKRILNEALVKFPENKKLQNKYKKYNFEE